MNRILYKRSFLFLLTFTLICWSIHPCFGRSAKPPTQPCANCHTGAAGSGSINITSLPAEYQTGEEYQIGVSISHDGQKRWGFLLQARDGSGNLVGDFSSIDDNTQAFSGYISHTSSGTFQGQSNSANWDLKWTAPAADVGSITFTAYGNAANNNGANSGDKGHTTTVAITAEEKATVVNIPDLNLRAALESALGKNAGDAITDTELATLTELTIGLRLAGIINLTGLEHCTGLTTLWLFGNSISDISAVANLTNLRVLYLNNNQINDITAVANLTNLTEVYLNSNEINDLSSLANLTNLRVLNLNSNEINDISSLANLTGLTGLYLYANQISDISAVSNLTNLTRLWLGNNQISDLSPLANLPNLTTLDLSRSQLIDLSGLANLTGLTGLWLYGNEISDISAVANLTNLTYLELRDNQISDITPIAENTGISGEITLQNNPLNNTALSTHIPALEARGIEVSYDISTIEVIHLSPGWNMVSIPGIPQKTDPATLQTVDNSLILPLYRWNSATFSYEPVTELKLGEGYWALTIRPEGTTLQIPITSADSYNRTLQPGWNMIGGVSQVSDFTNPQDDPDNSVIAGTLYSWNPTSFSYQAKTEITPGQGYWVLTLAECQLTVGGEVSVPTAPQIILEPEMVISFNLSAGDWHQNLKIGLDQSAAAGLELMDWVLPPIGPQAQDYQAHLVSGQYQLRRDIRPITDQMVSWQIRLSSPEPVQLTVDNQEIPAGQELIISDGWMETVLSAGMEMQLASGERELTISLRPLPKATALLQNYPNPFNPETWIPFELNQDSEVSLTIYDMAGRLVRRLDIGFQEAGTYLRRDQAIYWDGRTQSGEQVASGTYFYTLKTADYVSTQKMIILK